MGFMTPEHLQDLTNILAALLPPNTTLTATARHSLLHCVYDLLTCVLARTGAPGTNTESEVGLGDIISAFHTEGFTKYENLCRSFSENLECCKGLEDGDLPSTAPSSSAGDMYALVDINVASRLVAESIVYSSRNSIVHSAVNSARLRYETELESLRAACARPGEKPGPGKSRKVAKKHKAGKARKSSFLEPNSSYTPYVPVHTVMMSPLSPAMHPLVAHQNVQHPPSPMTHGASSPFVQMFSPHIPAAQPFKQSPMHTPTLFSGGYPFYASNDLSYQNHYKPAPPLDLSAGATRRNELDMFRRTKPVGGRTLSAQRVEAKEKEGSDGTALCAISGSQQRKRFQE